MGTKGIVAVGSPTAWQGVSQLRDGYPTSLGRKVWEQAQRKGWGSLARDLLKHGTWKSYERQGTCIYCGKPAEHVIQHGGPLVGWTVPQHIREMIKHIPTSPDVEAEDALAEANAKRTGYPDPDGLWHSHTGETVEELQVERSEACSSMEWEWVYLIDAEARCLRIYRAGNDTYILVGELDWDGPEPDWPSLEARDSPIH